MQLDESFVVYALWVPGRMALSIVLCSVAFIFVMSLIPLDFGRHYPVLSGQMSSYLVVRRQGFDSHILVTHDLLRLLELSLVG